MGRAAASAVFFSNKQIVTQSIPGMLEGFAACETLVDIDTHESTDEILGGIANFVPIRRVKLEFT